MPALACQRARSGFVSGVVVLDAGGRVFERLHPLMLPNRSRSGAAKSPKQCLVFRVDVAQQRPQRQHLRLAFFLQLESKPRPMTTRDAFLL